jgi:hypothetical protein
MAPRLDRDGHPAALDAQRLAGAVDGEGLEGGAIGEGEDVLAAAAGLQLDPEGGLGAAGAGPDGERDLLDGQGLALGAGGTGDVDAQALARPGLPARHARRRRFLQHRRDARGLHVPDGSGVQAPDLREGRGGGGHQIEAGAALVEGG